MKNKTGDVEKITVTIPADLLAQLDAVAAAEHRSRSGQVQFFLSKAVARRATDPADTRCRATA